MLEAKAFYGVPPPAEPVVSEINEAKKFPGVDPPGTFLFICLNLFTGSIGC